MDRATSRAGVPLSSSDVDRVEKSLCVFDGGILLV